MTPCASCGREIDTNADPSAFVTECGTVIECRECREGEKETD